MQAEEPRAEYLFDLGGQFHHWRETLHRYTAREITPTDHFWEFIRPARDELKRFSDVEALLAVVEDKLKGAGWEGDGTINLVWVPPFAFRGQSGDGYLVFHVKQINNGSTFIVEPPHAISP